MRQTIEIKIDGHKWQLFVNGEDLTSTVKWLRFETETMVENKIEIELRQPAQIHVMGEVFPKGVGYADR